MPICLVPIISVSCRSWSQSSPYDLPESPVAALPIAQRCVVQRARVNSTSLIVQRYRLVQPGRAHMHHIHTVHDRCGGGPGWDSVERLCKLQKRYDQQSLSSVGQQLFSIEQATATAHKQSPAVQAMLVLRPQATVKAKHLIHLPYVEQSDDNADIIDKQSTLIGGEYT